MQLKAFYYYLKRAKCAFMGELTPFDIKGDGVKLICHCQNLRRGHKQDARVWGDKSAQQLRIGNAVNFGPVSCYPKPCLAVFIRQRMSADKWQPLLPSRAKTTA